MAARSVRCRGGAVRSPLVSRWNRSLSRDAIWSTDSTRTQAAASSMASGSPSSARQTATTDASWPGPATKPGAAAAARSANSRTAS